MTRFRLAAPLTALVLVAQAFAFAPGAAADAPITQDDSVVVQKDAGASSLAVLANDTIGPDAVITEVSDPANGSATAAVDGLSVDYTPDASYTGPDSFTYTVHDPVDGDSTSTVTVKVNAPPVAVADPNLLDNCSYVASQTFALPEDKTTPFEASGSSGHCNLLWNDTDSDGTVVNWELVSGPSHGQVANELPLAVPGLSSDFSYTPDPDYFTLPGNQPGGSWVSDSFTYRAVDDDGGVSAPVTVSFWIAPVNDAPTFTPGASTVHGSAGVASSQGWASAISAGPNEGYQTVGFVLTPDAGNPVGLFSSAPSIAADGTLSFTGAAGHSGSALFQVVAKDDGGLESYGSGSGQPTARDTSDPVSLTITVDGTNASPDAVDDTAELDEDAGATAVDVLANDTDTDGDTLHVTGTTDGTKGTVAITGGGTGLTYTPNANANGADAFTYTIDDGHGGSDTATVDVTIDPVNDNPDASADTLTLAEDAAATAVDVLANDTDPENDTLTITAKTNGAKGTVTITGGGTGLTYKPNANAFGSDSFTYTVSDGHGGTDSASVAVTITAVNDNPNAVNDPGPTTIYRSALPRAIAVLANDTSAPDGPETLTIVAVTQGSHGKVAITGGGTGLTYVATGTALGLDVFTYTISDGHGGTDTASVQVKVVADTSKPVAAITSIGKASVTGHPTLIRLTVKWTLTDSGSGLRSQLVQRRMDSGSWVTVSVASSATRSIATTLPRHHTWSFRVRGVDRAGNVGTFATRSIKV